MADHKPDTLEDHGILYLTGAITPESSEALARAILLANLKGRHQRLQLIVNSPGGDVGAGFALLDVMEWSAIPIYTVGLGQVASMGLLVLMAGAKGHRVVSPRTSLLSHRMWWLGAGTHAEHMAARREEDRSHERIVDHYLRHTALESRDDVLKHLLRDTDVWLDAEEAVRFGVVDRVEGQPRLSPGVTP